MRFVITLGVIAATTVLITPSKAQNYPWCAIYSGGMVTPSALAVVAAILREYRQLPELIRRP